MKTTHLHHWQALILIAAFFAAGNRAFPQTSAATWESPGTNKVETVEYDWLDAKRARKVPVKIYYPSDAGGKFPVIVFSHGLGGSREGYEYLGRYWAGHGFVSVHLQHIGSDDSVWRGLPPAEIMPALKNAVADVENAVNRPVDVKFVLDEIEKMNTQADSPLKGRLDLAHIGVAGHSFGAHTTMALSGQVFVLPGGDRKSFGDSRIKAAIAMSPPAPTKYSPTDIAFSKISIPMFHMTGTLDDSPIGETSAAQRRIPFDHINNADQYLVTFNGGDHMVFSGRGIGRVSRDKDPLFQKLICECSTAFWDAYLKDDRAALAWLNDGGFKNTLGADGVFEKKHPDMTAAGR